MTTYTWNGSAGGFDDPANWSPNAVPGAGDTALVGAGDVQFRPFSAPFTGGQTFLLSGASTLTFQTNPFTTLSGDTRILPTDVASAATAKLSFGGGGGFLTVGGGTLVVAVPTEGQGSFKIGAGTLEFGASVGAGVRVSFAGSGNSSGGPAGATGASLLKLDRPAAFQGAIGAESGTGAGRVTIPAGSAIDLVGVVADRVAFAPSTAANAQPNDAVLRVLNGGTTVAGLNLSAPSVAFSVAPDGAGGTLIRSDFDRTSGSRRQLGDGLEVPGSRSAYSISPTTDVTIVSGAGLTDYVTPGTYLAFTDGTLSFNARDPGAEIYRLYEAALSRAPDEGGNLYWAGREQAGAGPVEIADGFLRSAEYRGAGLNDERFVAQLYQNALGRAPDAAGEAYWTGLLDGGRSRAEVLAGVSSTFEAEQHSAIGIAAMGVFYPNVPGGA